MSSTNLAMGAFGIKVPAEYGGLGLSPLAYVRAMAMVTSKDGSLTAMLSASQSIGVPQPLALFGTDEQKRRFFPRLAKGATLGIRADGRSMRAPIPANMTTSAVPTSDGSHYVINGEKLWCTNGTAAELFVVMARTPDVVVRGKPRKQITAFIVERDMPGVEVVHRLRFMGLKAIENGVIRFRDVRVPRENILWGEGKGLKLALTTLNTGRLTLPASCAAVGKAMLEVARTWSNERVQWGQPIGRHEAVAHKIARMASTTFAMEAVAELATLLYQRGGYDIRLEAAVAKLYNSEAGWRIVDDTLQIRGGRGYEMAESLARRGERPIPIERAMRDYRINLIFEGSSEIMRLFIAREAVDHHMRTAFPLVDPESSMRERMRALGRVARFYPAWYAGRLVGRGQLPSYGEFGRLATHLRYAERTTRRLGRAILHAMVRFGPKPRAPPDGVVPGRRYWCGAVRDVSRLCAGPDARAGRPARGADDGRCVLPRGARADRTDLQPTVRAGRTRSRLARQVLDGQHTWLESGIVGLRGRDA